MGLTGQLAILLMATCYVGRVDAADGPIVQLNSADYPYLVMVVGDDNGDLTISPGVFLSTQLVLSHVDVGFGDTAYVVVGGKNQPVANVWTNYNVAVYKICYKKYAGPFQALTPSNYFDFATNVTATIAFFYGNGTLFGQTRTVLATANCPQEYTDTGIDSSFISTDGSEACAQFDATGDCSYKTLPEKIYPVLVINGVVVAIMNNARCLANGLYNAPSEFNVIQFYRDYILSVAPDAIP
ncbi:uncharacterized protein LOC132199008 [Neocloeon triangulifer]|uniref:uncharacterized protein LOC132199008 n=1 Tax=Neocloeon triangulifer TaxID=2078957 RepID=UPI00286EFEFA|nr:uncharacterized protein LOC132199008 [Neocloeon triangulifer]